LTGLSALQLPQEESSCEAPLALDGLGADTQHVGDFVDGEVEDESKARNLGGSRRAGLERLQSAHEDCRIGRSCPVVASEFAGDDIKRYRPGTVPTLHTIACTSAVEEMLLDRLGERGREVAPSSPLRKSGSKDSHVRLVCDTAHLQVW
jgi:hypothetical protein